MPVKVEDLSAQGATCLNCALHALAQGVLFDSSFLLFEKFAGTFYVLAV
jgi:hypothetical protein